MSSQEETASRVAWPPELRIANPPPSLLVKYTQKEKTFFYGYADFVLALVDNPIVSDRIRQILETENVHISGPIDVRIMVFPARTFRGQSSRMLHGSYSSTASQISLYPLRIPKEWVNHEGFDLFQKTFAEQSERRKKLLIEISSSALATLLHELFHAKLESRGLSRYVEESIVKSMEKSYMKGWQGTIDKAVADTLADIVVTRTLQEED